VGRRLAMIGASRPLLRLVTVRIALGLLTLLLVSMLVFAATEVLPGNAAQAVLQNTATPARLHALERQLHLNESIPAQYWHWITGILRGDPGSSLANGQPVGALVRPRLANSAVLVILAGVIGSVLGVGLGILAAWKRDGWLDYGLSSAALAITALPEFLIAIVLVIIFATVLTHLLPAVSVFSASSSAWMHPEALILPVATLVLLITPYVFRMARGAMIEALSSDAVEMAELNGLSRRRVLGVYALVNAIPPIVQVIGLNLLYLAGGIVVVEYVFNYPGVGQALVSAVSNRDIPVIQWIVLILAAFYVLVNIMTDVIALVASPRRRLPRTR
jgi:peptide/nickel transport system permease protein